MAYTFGGATTDDITATSAASSGGNGNQTLYAGWWYPTTLTATRGYCSAGNIYGMEVDTTTSELRFRTDNTTDGQWTTTGAAIAVDNWWFIAFMSTQNNTGPAGAFRCWVGTPVLPPAEVTVTGAVTPIGNFTASAVRYAGNKGTASTAFQGDVGCLSIIAGSAAGSNSPLGIGTAGAITNAEAEFALLRWVRPLWAGRADLMSASYQAIGNGFSLMHMPLNAGRVAYHWSNDQTVASTLELTINGATLSERAPPRVPPENWPVQLACARSD